MKEIYVTYKGVRMTEQEAEARINNAYCDAADKKRSAGKSKTNSGSKATPVKKTQRKG